MRGIMSQVHCAHSPLVFFWEVIMLSKQYQCPDCGGFDGYRSRRRNLLEKYVLPLVMLQPVRCMSCYRRTHVSVFLHLPERENKLSTRGQAAA
jgi:hypothetical protein